MNLRSEASIYIKNECVYGAAPLGGSPELHTAPQFAVGVLVFPRASPYDSVLRFTTNDICIDRFKQTQPPCVSAPTADYKAG